MSYLSTCLLFLSVQLLSSMAWHACHHSREVVERANHSLTHSLITPHCLRHTGPAAAFVAQAKNALRQKWRGKTLPDIATVCRPVRSSRRPAGYSANDASHAARPGGALSFVGMHCAPVPVRMQLLACTQLHCICIHHKRERAHALGAGRSAEATR